jgi:hypothetical protein
MCIARPQGKRKNSYDQSFIDRQVMQTAMSGVRVKHGPRSVKQAETVKIAYEPCTVSNYHNISK